jgi:hypothetical protein
LIATLTIVIITLVARIVYLEFARRDLEAETSEYRMLVMEWYNYLSDKKYGDDFRLWKQELENE